MLVEYGPDGLDLELRLHVHALMSWLENRDLPGILDLTPGIRSLQVHYDSRILSLDLLLSTLTAAESALPAIDDMQVPTRIVNLPLSWDDDATQLAIAKYMQSVRADAPWCPSNIEFIRRINGLDSIDEVRRIVFEASYLVLGLGDVYLGAPVATPLDPRHRLVTTKYNPARTWTPENAVGIGGAYLCVYGMEGPGGYQFVGRTCQMWNTYTRNRCIHPRSTLAAAVLRSDCGFIPYPRANCWIFGLISCTGERRCKSATRLFGCETIVDSSPTTRRASPRTRRVNKPHSKQNAVRWQATGQISYPADLPDSHDESACDELQAVA